MKRTPRTYKAIPEQVETASGDLARELGLPWKQAGLPRMLIGRREWVGLPDLGISPLNAKTDSGARSSSLHAEDIILSEDGSRVGFVTVNHYGDRISCEAPVVMTKKVRSSSGAAKKRLFIETKAVLAGGFTCVIRLSLANRSVMRCPMLIGRRALSGFFLIDPQSSHLLGGVRDLEHFVPGTRPS
ncbi:MAG: RimK/LysX family protein [Luteolibacter sp.]